MERLLERLKLLRLLEASLRLNRLWADTFDGSPRSTARSERLQRIERAQMRVEERITGERSVML